MGWSEERSKKVAFQCFWAMNSNFIRAMTSGIGPLRDDGYEMMSHSPSRSFIEEMRSVMDAMMGEPKRWLLATSQGTLQRGVTGQDFEGLSCAHLSGLEEGCDRRAWIESIDLVFGASLRNYYGGEYRLLSLDAYVTLPSSKEQLDGSFRWHIDDHPPGLIKGFICLDDVDESCGPTEVLPRSLRMPLSSFVDRSANTDWRFSEDVSEKMGLEPRLLTGVAGAAYLLNANTIHRATTVNIGKRRRVISIMFLPSRISAEESWRRDGLVAIESQPDRIFEPLW